MSIVTGECSECGKTKRCIKASDGIICENCLVPEEIPWYEKLKPGTLVIGFGNDHPYVAYQYVSGYVYDFNHNIIGKPAHLKLATTAERDRLYCEEYYHD